MKTISIILLILTATIMVGCEDPVVEPEEEPATENVDELFPPIEMIDNQIKELEAEAAEATE